MLALIVSDPTTALHRRNRIHAQAYIRSVLIELGFVYAFSSLSSWVSCVVGG